MKKFRAYLIYIVLMPLSACQFTADLFWVDTKVYIFELPEIPHEWNDVLGSPAWRLEWLSEQGHISSMDVPLGVITTEVSLSIHQPGPILAWPYWPQLGITPHRTRPAGALLPLDVQQNRCRLTWMGGIEATLFYLLKTSPGNAKYDPDTFNWPRFRKLFSEKKLPLAVLADPWCVDWALVATKTRLSGFDSRRLVSQPTKPLFVTLPDVGPWVADSPFIPYLLEGRASEELKITLETTASVNTILSAHGIIAYSWDGIAYISGFHDP
ncbi:hypothetical protein [Gracilinema caldarium]|uniref:Uncharacterized protein n=1 Tax=Gracilinema caldarium (strain ATCC 51460 / DSM 7334 / H1) TaxID=744872 RepID=F8F0U2_GRAC1|nr:hypothetical protein [Gracilinema caldarium]AEJ20228.1 hypothetical protein Spica_2103 [Gracilinema caldarium DSM 7334]